MTEKRKRINFVSILAVAVLMLISSISGFADNISLENAGKSQKESSQILSVIDCYQKDYFSVIKRNDMFLQTEDNKTLNKDRKDLNKLYKKVKKQIKNKDYLKKYNDIQKRYAKCDDETDTGMKEFAFRNYMEADKLLNEVYKEVKSKISQEDFTNLTKSEKDWLKNVKDYENVYSSMDYGTIGTLIYYEYKINMTEFRTLLLMLYL